MEYGRDVGGQTVVNPAAMALEAVAPTDWNIFCPAAVIGVSLKFNRSGTASLLTKAGVDGDSFGMDDDDDIG